MNSSHISSKVWSFCTILKDDGVSYGDYLEQLTYPGYLTKVTCGRNLSHLYRFLY